VIAQTQALDGALDDALFTMEEALEAYPDQLDFRPFLLQLRGEINLRNSAPISRLWRKLDLSAPRLARRMTRDRLSALLGDRRWIAVLSRYYAALRRDLRAKRGKEMRTTGDGMLACFDGQAGATAAVRCATAMRQAVRTLGLEIRVGLHAGECERVEDEVGGIALHIGVRVMARADPDEVLVSSAVKDPVVGSALKFH
jgi:hypothetical protein